MYGNRSATVFRQTSVLVCLLSSGGTRYRQNVPIHPTVAKLISTILGELMPSLSYRVPGRGHATKRAQQRS
jgi:hypothetical protein